MLSQIALIDVEGWFTVQLVKDIASTARHLSGWTERFPATEGTMRELQAGTAQANGDHPISAYTIAVQRKGFLECAAIASQSAGNRNHRANYAAHAIDERATIDFHPGSKQQYRLKIRSSELLSKALSSCKGVVHAGKASAALTQTGFFKIDGGDGTSAIINSIRSNFSRSRTA